MIVVVAPDSYKGSLSAAEAAEAMKRGIASAAPSAIVRMLPMADGGEGFAEAIVKSRNGTTVPVEVMGPLGEPVPSWFGVIDNGRTAVIEMAAASGLTLVPPDRRNPLIATTFGTGQLIRAALEHGCRKILIGLGGSATNDGGIGMAQALGYRFLDHAGEEIAAGTGRWMEVDRIDGSQRDRRLDKAEIIAACDVDAVLYGTYGASTIFGPQKGASPQMVFMLDQALRRLAYCLERDLSVHVDALPGGGAAGGLGAGLAAFCGAELCKGVELVIEACRLDEMLEGAELVLTGEGNTDRQSAMGKTPAGVARRAKKKGIPTICLSGGLGEGYEILREQGITAFFSIVPRPAEISECMDRAKEWLEETAREILHLYRSAYKGRAGCSICAPPLPNR